MTTQSYIVLIRDSRLASAVGVALQDRLLRDGHRAIAFAADPGEMGKLHEHCRGWRSEPEPLVVALYEDGLLPGLASLGLAAYVGAPEEVGWQVISWDNGLGAMMLPVSSARDLVEAVASHTPWSAYAHARVPADAELPVAFGGADSARQIQTSSSRPAGPFALSRKLAVAGIAAPLLVVGLPTAAAAAAATPTSTGSVSRSADPADISVVLTSSVQRSQAGDQVAQAEIAGSLQPQAQAPVTNAQANGSSWWQGAVNALPNAANYMVEGGKIGAAGGAVAGAVGGGILGATAGTSLEPGGGTVAGWYGGAYSGAKLGAVAGGVLGSTAGFIYGFVTSPTWSTTPDTKGADNVGMNMTNPDGTTTTGAAAGPQGSQSRSLDGTSGNATGSQPGTQDGATGNPSGSQGNKATGNGTTSTGAGGTTSSGAGTTSSGAGNTSSGAGNTSSGAGNTSSGAGNASSGAGNTSSGAGSTSSGAGSSSNGSSSGGGSAAGGTSGGGGASNGGSTS